MLSNEQIEAKFNSLDSYNKALRTAMDRMSAELANKSNITDTNRNISELKDLIRQNSISIQALTDKLSKVILPEETRMYLDGGEVESYQSNFNTLRAMMVKFDKLYKNLVAYESKLSNS